MPENQLTDTDELPVDELRDLYLDDKPTVDELKDALESEDYSADQLQILKDAEEADGDRTTAVDALEDALEDAEPANPVPEEVESVASSPRSYQSGTTPQDVDEVDIPSPHAEDAPETIRVEILRPMGFAGEFFNQPGTYELAFAEPNETSIKGKQLRKSLLAATNDVYLSEDDALHPENDGGLSGRSA